MVLTGRFGYPVNAISDLIKQVVTGLIQIMAGRGFQIMTGAGHRFHYGRWNYETSVGWYWVPDYDWGPAWVAWRGSGDYYGWAPLSPGLNISVGVSFGNQIPQDRWVFAPHRYINKSLCKQVLCATYP